MTLMLGPWPGSVFVFVVRVGLLGGAGAIARGDPGLRFQDDLDREGNAHLTQDTCQEPMSHDERIQDTSGDNQH